MLSVKQFSLSLNGSTLISNLHFDIADGQVLSIMGPSGIGKSSLLHFLSGTLHHGNQAGGLMASGEASLHGIDLNNQATENRKVGLLQQMPLLFPHMSIIENLLFAIPENLHRQDRYASAQQALEKLGIPDKANALPKALSGGQQARVALLRTLLAKPDYLLLDEPFSKLDPALRRDVRAFVLNEIQQANIPALLVTHDPDDAKAMKGQCIELNTRNTSNADITTDK